jgi:FkbM family methyltransferase
MRDLLRRTWIHARLGTLLQRIRERYAYRKVLRRATRWDRQVVRHPYLVADIKPGVRMRLPSGGKLARAIYCGNFEQVERQFLRRFLRQGDCFVDIGANIGLFTLIAAHYVGPTGLVYAFEPSPCTFDRLRDNVVLNRMHNVQCHQLALSDQELVQPLTVALDGWDAWSSLAHPIAGSSFATEHVACVTWDQFAVEHTLAGNVTMMKIDVEGWEERVLAGGAQTLARPNAPLLQVEFTDAAAQSAGTCCAQLYATLTDLGYHMFIYDDARHTLLPDPLRAAYPHLNLLAVKHPERVAERLRRR